MRRQVRDEDGFISQKLEEVVRSCEPLADELVERLLSNVSGDIGEHYCRARVEAVEDFLQVHNESATGDWLCRSSGGR